MTSWHLLWMFVTALGIIALGVAVPIVWAWARQYRSNEQVLYRQMLWRVYRAHNAKLDGLARKAAS